MSVHHEVRKVDKVVARGDFELRSYNNDIALVKMDRPVEWSEAVRPLCLPEASGQEDDYTGDMADIIGWGRLQYNGKTASRLREAAVPVISQRQCRHESKYSSEEITDNMICAGFKDAHIDACQGDSGGPLIKKEKNFKMLIGIVSGGIECAKPGYPGVYTRVDRYLEWIRDTLVEENECICGQDQEEEEEEQKNQGGETSKESLQEEIRRLRKRLDLLAQKGGEVIVTLASQLEKKDSVIGDLQNTIRRLQTSNGTDFSHSNMTDVSPSRLDI